MRSRSTCILPEPGQQTMKVHTYPCRKAARKGDGESTAELRSLVVRLLEMQEEERQAVARKLHDTAGQTLTLLCLLLGQTKDFVSQDGVGYVNQAREAAMELAAELRAIWTGMRPGSLDDIGLLAALKWHLEDFTRRTGIEVQFDHRGLERNLPQDVRTAVYRIVQEALLNVARHAMANRVSVDVDCSEHMLIIDIRDDGVGFESKAIPSRCSGLMVIRERARHLNGKLSLESAPGNGTHVAVELKLIAEAPAL